MTLANLALTFALSGIVVVAAGTVLARNGDIIAAATNLGGLWVGSVFLALATSLGLTREERLGRVALGRNRLTSEMTTGLAREHGGHAS